MEDKLDGVDAALDKWKGREDRMFDALYKKYDAEITKYWDAQVRLRVRVRVMVRVRVTFCLTLTLTLSLLLNPNPNPNLNQREKDDAAAYDDEIAGDHAGEEEEAAMNKAFGSAAKDEV